MPKRFDSHLNVLPRAQKEIWPHLAAVAPSSFVLYGGTAVALHLGHRQSLDFDFFRAEPLDKDTLRAKLAFVGGATIVQDAPDTFVVLAQMPSGEVKVSFFGSIGFG